jgi:hypothetical protein
MSLFRCRECGEEFEEPKVSRGGRGRCPRCGEPLTLGRDEPEVPELKQTEKPAIWPSLGGTLAGGYLGGGIAYVAVLAAGSGGLALVSGVIALVVVIICGSLATMGLTVLAGTGSPGKGLTGGSIAGGIFGVTMGGMVAVFVLFVSYFAASCGGAFNPNKQQRDQQIADAESQANKAACAAFAFCVAGGTLAGAVSGLTGTMFGLAILAGYKSDRLADLDDRDRDDRRYGMDDIDRGDWNRRDR